MFIILRSCLGMKKVPHLFLTLVILLTFLIISLPFVQCSTSTRIYRTKMGGSRLITTIEVARFGNFEAPSSSSSVSVVGTVEESARKIPTGPDPLHHNNNPLEP